MNLRAGALRSASLIVIALTAACASFGAPSIPAVAGEYEGSINVQGQSISGGLTIEQAGTELQAVFVAPELSLRAEGSGSVDSDGNVRMTLQYDLQCPGEAQLAGSLNDAGTELSGRLDAGDCTGDISGTFSFRRAG